MEKEKPYQPTEEEMQKAEEKMLSSDQGRRLSWVTGRFVERKLLGVEFLDNGKVELNFGEREARPKERTNSIFPVEINNFIETPNTVIDFLTEAEVGLELELKKLIEWTESQKEQIKKAKKEIIERLNKEKEQSV